MSDQDNKDKEIDFFLTTVETQGVACSTVADGHVLMFKTSWLKSLLEKYEDKPQISIFIKRPDFKN
jgi:hypothetical protein